MHQLVPEIEQDTIGVVAGRGIRHNRRLREELVLGGVRGVVVLVGPSSPDLEALEGGSCCSRGDSRWGWGSGSDGGSLEPLRVV